MEVKIHINLQDMLEDASPELTNILVNQYIGKMEIVVLRVGRAARDVAARDQLFKHDDHVEWTIVDDALEEMCAHLRPEYARYKYLCDWLCSCPRQAGPCLSACKAKLEALKDIQRQLKEVFGR